MLTNVLRHSLSGNTETTMVIAASPHSSNTRETYDSLVFGQACKQMKNVVISNKEESKEELQERIKKLEEENERLSGLVKDNVKQSLSPRGSGPSESATHSKFKEAKAKEKDQHLEESKKKYEAIALEALEGLEAATQETEKYKQLYLHAEKQAEREAQEAEEEKEEFEKNIAKMKEQLLI
eukprot:UN33545